MLKVKRVYTLKNKIYSNLDIMLMRDGRTT